QIEASTPEVGWARDLRPGGGFFGEGQRVRVLQMDDLIESLEEVSGLQVLAPAELVGDPFARLAGVVQVEHGCNGIQAKPVDVVLLQPEQSAGEQEGSHFVAPVVVDERTPVLVFALARVGVLVKVRTVEKGKAVPVFGEMRRNPIQDDPESGLVGLVDKVAEVIGGAEARGGRKVAGRLVTPRTVIGMLGDGHELDMAISHVFDVLHKLLGKLTIAEPAHPDGVECALPGTEMDFVDRDGRVKTLATLAGGHPFPVAPLVAVEIPDYGGRVGTHFREQAKGVRFDGDVALVAGLDFVSVQLALLEAGN